MELLTPVRRRAAAALAAAPALAALGGCELMRDPTPLEAVEQMVAVHAILVAGEDTARVLVTRVFVDRLGSWPPAEPVTGATVQLTRGDETIVLVEGADSGCFAARFLGSTLSSGLGCYVGVVPGGIASGGHYELAVTLPGGGAIRGGTTVPRLPALLAPTAGAQIEMGAPNGTGQDLPPPFTVRWSAAAPDGRAAIALRAAEPNCVALLSDGTPEGSVGSIDVTGADSASVRAGLVECGGRTPASLDAHLVLTTYDANYTAYADALDRTARSNALSRVSAGITGAAGVFGSAATAAVPVVLVRR